MQRIQRVRFISSSITKKFIRPTSQPCFSQGQHHRCFSTVKDKNHSSHPDLNSLKESVNHLLKIETPSTFQSEVFQLWKAKIGNSPQPSEKRWLSHSKHQAISKGPQLMTNFQHPIPIMIAEIFQDVTDLRTVSYYWTKLTEKTVTIMMKPNYSYLANLELLQLYLQKDHFSAAEWCYDEILKLDLPFPEEVVHFSFIKPIKLPNSKSISFLKTLMKNHSPSISIVVHAAAPLILAGYTKEFSKMLELLLTDPRNVKLPGGIPPARRVCSIVGSLCRARIRRTLSAHPLSKQEETSMKNIDKTLQNYIEKCRSINDNLESVVAIQSILNYLETSEVWKEHEKYILESFEEDRRKDRRNFSFLSTTFPYLSEQRSLFPLDEADNDNSTNFSDLTTLSAKEAELNNKLQNRPLYLASLFPGDLELQLAFTWRLQCEFMTGSDNESEDDDDDDDYEDDEDDDDDDDDDDDLDSDDGDDEDSDDGNGDADDEEDLVGGVDDEDDNKDDNGDDPTTSFDDEDEVMKAFKQACEEVSEILRIHDLEFEIELNDSPKELPEGHGYCKTLATTDICDLTSLKRKESPDNDNHMKFLSKLFEKSTFDEGYVSDVFGEQEPIIAAAGQPVVAKKKEVKSAVPTSPDDDDDKGMAAGTAIPRAENTKDDL